MPDAVVIVVRLKDKTVGVLCSAKMYQIQLEAALKESTDYKDFRTIEFPDYHTKTLPEQIRKGNLEGLVCRSTTNVKLDCEEYELHIYKVPFDIICKEIEKLSPN